jgi:hypothetical protein
VLVLVLVLVLGLVVVDAAVALVVDGGGACSPGGAAVLTSMVTSVRSGGRCLAAFGVFGAGSFGPGSQPMAPNITTVEKRRASDLMAQRYAGASTNEARRRTRRVLPQTAIRSLG